MLVQRGDLFFDGRPGAAGLRQRMPDVRRDGQERVVRKSTRRLPLST
jgi:hypothetical protein